MAIIMIIGIHVSYLCFSNKMDIGGALRDALVEAQPQGRLTFGVYESSKMLEM